jgi:predicted nucleic acid-binding Zn ribbon protein
MAKKECPFCQKRITENSVVCKYCKKDLSKSPKTFLRGNVLVALVIIVVVIGLWILMRQSNMKPIPQISDSSQPVEKQVAVVDSVKPAEQEEIVAPTDIVEPEQPVEMVVGGNEVEEDACTEPDRPVIIPDMAIRHSKDTDRVLFFDTSQSFCYEIVNCVKKELECSYKWDFGGPGDVVGGNGKDVFVYRYDNVGEHEASVSMTATESGKEATDYILVVAEAVKRVLPPLDFITTVEESTAIISADVSEDIAQLIVFWGDRSRSEYSFPFNELVEHTYTGSGKYSLRVQVVDNEGNIFNYTVRNDTSLIVEIP